MAHEIPDMPYDPWHGLPHPEVVHRSRLHVFILLAEASFDRYRVTGDPKYAKRHNELKQRVHDEALVWGSL